MMLDFFKGDLQSQLQDETSQTALDLFRVHGRSYYAGRKRLPHDQLTAVKGHETH